MRFSIFQLPLSHDPAHDGQVMEESLNQAILADELGFDGVWLADHNFTGESAFADPIIFATAIARHTSKVEIGFAVLQLALYHPIRLAIQLAALDQLSQGRLRVGVGRGSAFNEWEYAGFGLTIDEGRARFAEALDLLTTAWTATDLDFQGTYYQVKVPAIRPRPYQQPHPPIYRSTLSPESTVEIGRQGLPILFPRLDGPTIRARLDDYVTGLRAANTPEDVIEARLLEAGFLKSVYVAETDEQAWAEVQDPIQRQLHALTESRRRYNTAEQAPSATGPQKGPDEGAEPLDPQIDTVPAKVQLSATMQRGLIVGSPESVAAQLADLNAHGLNHLMASMNIGGMPGDQVERSMRLFASEVMPALRSLEPRSVLTA